MGEPGEVGPDGVPGEKGDAGMVAEKGNIGDPGTYCMCMGEPGEVGPDGEGRCWDGGREGEHGRSRYILHVYG